MQPTYQQQAKTKFIVAVVTVIVIAGLVLLADHLKAKPTAAATAIATSTPAVTPASNSPASTPDTINTDTPTSSTNGSTYKDGTYTASSEYYVPDGYEKISVTVSIKDDVIAGSSVINSQGDRDSAEYQQEFTSVYKSYVVGKKVSGLQLRVIAGASDTTQAFNDALRQIASKAQA